MCHTYTYVLLLLNHFEPQNILLHFVNYQFITLSTFQLFNLPRVYKYYRRILTTFYEKLFSLQFNTCTALQSVHGEVRNFEGLYFEDWFLKHLRIIIMYEDQYFLVGSRFNLTVLYI